MHLVVSEKKQQHKVARLFFRSVTFSSLPRGTERISFLVAANVYMCSVEGREN